MLSKTCLVVRKTAKEHQKGACSLLNVLGRCRIRIPHHVTPQNVVKLDNKICESKSETKVEN